MSTNNCILFGAHSPVPKRHERVGVASCAQLCPSTPQTEGDNTTNTLCGRAHTCLNFTFQQIKTTLLQIFRARGAFSKNKDLDAIQDTHTLINPGCSFLLVRLELLIRRWRQRVVMLSCHLSVPFCWKSLGHESFVSRLGTARLGSHMG